MENCKVKSTDGDPLSLVVYSPINPDISFTFTGANAEEVAQWYVRCLHLYYIFGYIFHFSHCASL